MRRLRYLLALLPVLYIFPFCSSPNPEKGFDVTVLNCNMITGFAGDGFERQLQSPSVRLVPGTKDQTESIKRVEVVAQTVQFVENNLERIKGFQETSDTR